MTRPAAGRIRILVRGAVQGVGFRPFVYGLAKEIGLTGFVTNSAQGAEIEVEGAEPSLAVFLKRLATELPYPGAIAGLETSVLDPVGFDAFAIAPSREEGPRTATVLPDIATCPKCLAEMRDRGDRRYRYPFINCTHCGPRYSIIRRLPYDRPFTSMAGFPMCPACRAEYEDPSNRRFHAQPIACPECGPHLALWSPQGTELAVRDEALIRACAVLQEGGILAVKGIGGFHLMVDARNEEAVARLRTRKRREAKPLAVMIPSLAWSRKAVELSEAEERLLTAPEAPIVIVRARSGFVAANVAPESSHIGLMTPYSPLHWLLMEELGFPAVATSGNLSEEPICTEEADAIERFREIADGLLVHNRPIVRPIDDSVARVMADRPVVFRRARGYSPLPIELPGVPGGLLAVGGHLKNAVAVTVDGSAIVGQHVGDLDTVSARDRMETEVRDLSELHQLGLVGVVHDLHPDYASTRFAEQTGLPLVGVQHHIAHAAACLAENEVCEPALAVVWDGTGFGLDGSIWGGEFFLASTEGIVRAACIRPFWLPGGEAAMREPRRSALGLLWEAFGHSAPQVLQDRLSDQFSTKEIKTLRTMLKVGKHCVRTSSTGRLFDAFAALGAGIGSSRFEGDAPMRFENLADGNEDAYPMSLDIRPDLVVLNWRPTLEALAIDLAAQAPIPKISSRFHKGLAEGICLVAAHFGLAPVALSGGCFQNRLLFEETWRRLTQRGFRPYGAQRIPPGDGGLAFGQMAAHRNSWEQRRETPHTRLLET